LRGQRNKTQQRLKTVPQPIDPKGRSSWIMIDGYQVGSRGPDWGKKKAQKPPRGIARTQGGAYFIITIKMQMASGWKNSAWAGKESRWNWENDSTKKPLGKV
jgi:hypothetical protein